LKHDGGPHVLVVDDDELVREVVMMSLAEAGFQAEGAEDARSALVLMSEGEVFDALITDFSMPGMNGLDLIREVRRRRLMLPAILLMSGTSQPPRVIMHLARGSRYCRSLCAHQNSQRGSPPSWIDPPFNRTHETDAAGLPSDVGCKTAEITEFALEFTKSA
jgi:CheY-like chemotaxis protein